MRHIKKFVAVFLTVIMLSACALPVVSLAADEINDHTSFEDFMAQVTDEDGNVDWTLVPTRLFGIFFLIRLIEAVMDFFRGLFGGTSAEGSVVVETTTALPEPPAIVD